MKKFRHRPKAYCATLLLAVCAPAWCQTVTTTPGTPTSVLPQSAYLIPSMPSIVNGLLLRYGNRLQQPGNERLTLSGTYTDTNGNSAATIVTDITGNAHVQLTGAVNKVVVWNGSQITANGAAAADTDQALVESIEGDAPEAFFYSWNRSAGIRFLGGRFRADDGANPVYNGPWYDIYEVVGKSTSPSGATLSRKLFYVDSDLRQVVQTRYQIQRNGATVNVQTVFSGWSLVNGQAVPGLIQRYENGLSVFSIAVASGQTGPALADGLFTASAGAQ